MAKSNNAFIKKQKAEIKRKKRLEKVAKKDARKRESTDGSLENMLAYVDEFGNLTSEPPEKKIESSTLKKTQ
jgi:S-adenosylmethionine hydrolase